VVLGTALKEEKKSTEIRKKANVESVGGTAGAKTLGIWL